MLKEEEIEPGLYEVEWPTGKKEKRPVMLISVPGQGVFKQLEVGSHAMISIPRAFANGVKFLQRLDD